MDTIERDGNMVFDHFDSSNTMDSCRIKLTEASSKILFCEKSTERSKKGSPIEISMWILINLLSLIEDLVLRAALIVRNYSVFYFLQTLTVVLFVAFLYFLQLYSVFSCLIIILNLFVQVKDTFYVLNFGWLQQRERKQSFSKEMRALSINKKMEKLNFKHTNESADAVLQQGL
jgi:hypothetical protein